MASPCKRTCVQRRQL